MTAPSPSWELQRAVVALLASTDDVKALLGLDPTRVYDDVPDKALSPYAIVGDDDETSAESEEVPGSAHSFAVTVVTTSIGFKECKTIAEVVKTALNDVLLDIPGFDVTPIHWRTTAHRTFPDRATLRMSRLVFETELRPTPLEE